MPEKTDLGKKFNSSNKTAIDEFNELCEKALDSPRPANRFECMDLLEEAVRKKKGAYTEANRQDWMQILYACLAAPNSYFIKDPIRAENKRVVLCKV